MNRIDVEDGRRRQLIAATIDTLAEVGFGATTLALIGQRAGVSAGLISHYFDDKDGLLEATLRSLASRLARATTERLRAARTPRERVQAVIDATLAPEEFDPRTCGVWLAFWGQVIHSARLKRVQTIYQQRMLSNLRHALRQLVPEAEARRLAIALAAMIDGALAPRHALLAQRDRQRHGARDGRRLHRRRNRPARGEARAGASAGTRSERERPVRNFIGGAAVASATGKTFATINPATGKVLAEVEIAGEAEVNHAVAAAKAAQPKWAAMTGMERGRILKTAAALLRERNAELALLETRDTGKPIQETSAVDVLSGADCLEYFAEHRRRARRRAHRPRAVGLRLYTPRTARRRRRDRRVELPAPDRLLEGRAGARLRQCHDLQAGGTDAAHGRQARRDPHRSRAAGRPLQRRPRLRRRRGACSPAIPTSPRSR